MKKCIGGNMNMNTENMQQPFEITKGKNEHQNAKSLITIFA